jgi:hypothetical protein
MKTVTSTKNRRMNRFLRGLLSQAMLIEDGLNLASQ